MTLEQTRGLHRQGRGAGYDVAARSELDEGPCSGDRIDAGMPVETPVLGGDQHPAIERIDSLGLDRQPPFAVGC